MRVRDDYLLYSWDNINHCFHFNFDIKNACKKGKISYFWIIFRSAWLVSPVFPLYIMSTRPMEEWEILAIPSLWKYHNEVHLCQRPFVASLTQCRGFGWKILLSILDSQSARQAGAPPPTNTILWPALCNAWKPHTQQKLLSRILLIFIWCSLQVSCNIFFSRA